MDNTPDDLELNYQVTGNLARWLAESCKVTIQKNYWGRVVLTVTKAGKELFRCYLAEEK
jgi:hypothetical protein